MNSFDVFGTLLARRYITAIPLSKQVEAEANIPGFSKRRIAADNGSSGLAEIYGALALPTEVMDLETGLELENVIPIRQNLQRVEHGDPLISDMYMSAFDIMSLLRAIGLEKQVTISQSNKGKSFDAVWRNLATHKPGCHVGDNVHLHFNLSRSMEFNYEL